MRVADEPQAQEGVDEGAERPEWLPDNFKTPEDLARSYHEAQRALTQSQQELRARERAYEEQLATLQAQQQQQAQPQTSLNDDQWLEAFERNPVQTMAFLAEQVAEQRVQAALAQQRQQIDPLGSTQHEIVAAYAKTQLASKYGDWDEYEPKIAEAIEADPSLVPPDVLSSPERAVKSLERAYKMIKADDVLSRAERAGQAQAEIGRDRKLAAQTMAGGATSRPASDTEADYHQRALKLAQGGNRYGVRPPGV